MKSSSAQPAWHATAHNSPLIAKFIDAAKPLSIQVHPDDGYAKIHEGSLGKTEAWYILEAQADATIIWGFARELDKDSLQKAISANRLEPYLNVVSVNAGDVIYNKAGTVHAVGSGIFLFEIQQASDITYRLYDYGRIDARGQTRELHIDKALAVADLSAANAAKQQPKKLSEQVTELVRSAHFVMEHWHLRRPRQCSTSPDSLELLTVLEGSCELVYGGTRLRLSPADSAVLPAALGEYQLAAEASLMRCYVP